MSALDKLNHKKSMLLLKCGDTMKRFTNIVFVADSDQINHSAFNQAVELAQRNQAKLTVAVCYDNLKQLSFAQPKQNLVIRDMLDFKLQHWQDEIKAIDAGLETGVKVMFGKPIIELVHEVSTNHRDLLIKSIDPPHQRSHVFFSSLDYKLLRKCPCPVWLIKDEAVLGDRDLVLAIDYEPDNPENEPLNEQLISMAVSLAMSEFAQLHVVHCWQLLHESFMRSTRAQNSPEEVDQWVGDMRKKRQRWLQDTLTKHTAAYDDTTQKFLNPQLHLIQGDATEAIPALIDDLGAELLLLGTVGRSGIPGYLIGNTAETILNLISCSVLAVKPPGFVSPIK